MSNNIIVEELQRALDNIEERKESLYEEITKCDSAITEIEGMIERRKPKEKTLLLFNKFESVTSAVRYIFAEEPDSRFTSVDVNNRLKRMVDKEELAIGENQKLNKLAHSSIYTLAKKGYIKRHHSDDPRVNNEYSLSVT